MSQQQQMPPQQIQQLQQIQQQIQMVLSGCRQMHTCQEDIKTITNTLKKKKEQVTKMQQELIQIMIQLNQRYIDVSGKGAGPYKTITVEKSYTSWTDQDDNDFMTMILNQIYSSPTKKFQAEEILRMKKEYQKKKKEGTEKLKLADWKQPPTFKNCDDLRKFLVQSDVQLMENAQNLIGKISRHQQQQHDDIKMDS